MSTRGVPVVVLDPQKRRRHRTNSFATVFAAPKNKPNRNLLLALRQRFPDHDWPLGPPPLPAASINPGVGTSSSDNRQEEEPDFDIQWNQMDVDEQGDGRIQEGDGTLAPAPATGDEATSETNRRRSHCRRCRMSEDLSYDPPDSSRPQTAADVSQILNGNTSPQTTPSATQYSPAPHPQFTRTETINPAVDGVVRTVLIACLALLGQFHATDRLLTFFLDLTCILLQQVGRLDAANAIPKSKKGVISALGLDVTQNRIVVCSKCWATYPQNTAHCVCQFVAFPNHVHLQKRLPCGTALFDVKKKPLKTMVYRPIVQSLVELL